MDIFDIVLSAVSQLIGISFYSVYSLLCPIDFVIQTDVYWHDLATICQRGCGFISNWWLLSDITQHATAKRHSVEDES